MNSLKAMTMSAAAFAFATAQIASASPAPNAKLWAATWHLVLAKSKFASPASAEKSEDRAYRITGNHVIMRSTTVTESGELLHWGYSATTDGNWFLVSGNPSMDHVKLTGVSPREIKAETMKLKHPVGSAVITVSEDGKELTIDRTGGAAGTGHDVLVFSRVE